MFPLLQIPQAMTAVPFNLDTFNMYSTQDATSNSYFYPLDARLPSPRTFPIRSSRSQRRGTVSSNPLYSTRSEHHLRRKTPNGTIDAGYDGSPAQPSLGPPPPKHMILTGAISSMTYPSTNPPQPRQYQAFLGEPRSLLIGDVSPDETDGGMWSYSVLWPSTHGAALQHSSHPEQHQRFLSPGWQYQAKTSTDANKPNVYQPLLRANEYNVRAFCPPPASMNDSLPFGQMSVPSMLLSPWECPPAQQSHPIPPSYVQRQTVSTASLPLHSMYMGKPTKPDISCDSTPLHSIPCTMIHGTDSELPAQNRSFGPGNQQAFRDKVLAQAHKCYLDLLAHFQSVRKCYAAKSDSQSCTTPKLIVYPKPPRPPKTTLTTHEDGLYPPQATQQTYRGNNNSSSNGALGSYASNRAHHRSFASGPYITQTTSSRDVQHGSQPDYQSSPSASGASPLTNAKSSLGVLNSLCEQSGWTWFDGMLLGGCLHYGMEHYEDALEWFSRIVTLDSSHVEAITNMAATLYCLDRQDEAEQQWLRAVKIRPSYLEAAEHLVGLLYKKRSREAIEIIDLVQRALRLPPHTSMQHLSTTCATELSEGSARYAMSLEYQLADTQQAQRYPVAQEGGGLGLSCEFGSSGYALPGKENGRILALIHAKGTMLYSLKEIGKASEAFEEAVLISAGRRLRGIQELVRRIQNALSPAEPRSPFYAQDTHPLQPLLLPPERARHTANLVFGGSGELPGLRGVAEGATKRAAVQTTSNSLLSLAKIFQDAVSTGSGSPELVRQPSGVGDILALYYLSLSLQESPSTANNVGILLAGIQQVTTKSLHVPSNAHAQPSIPGIIPGSGLALALAYYHYGLRLDPKHVHLHTNLGSLLKDIGQLDLAIQMYEQAVSCDATFDIALTNLANAVKDRGRINDAIMYYKRAVTSNPEFAEAVCGLLTALNSVCDWRGRGGILLQSGKYDRWHVDEKGLLVDGRAQGHGSGLVQRVVNIVGRQLHEASRWGCGILDENSIRELAIDLGPLCSDDSFDLIEALRDWAGKPWEGSRVLRLIERGTRMAQRQWYCDRNDRHDAEPAKYHRPRLLPSISVPAAPTVLPFHTFTSPLTASEIRIISQRNATRISFSTLRLPWIPSTVYAPPPPPKPCLHVGYVSSDFNNHPLAHLMQSVFGLHDSRRVRAFCYATTSSDNSIHRQKIEREAPVFHDVSSWPPDKLVEQIIRDEIHILVNLNGYTRGARNEIFAARPAPIQMSFMGFAGTLGAEWCDYILADSTAIPPATLRPWRRNVSVEDVFRDANERSGNDWMYSENIIFCRDTFFCCDHAQSCDAGERSVTWDEEQRRRWKMRQELFPSLPKDAIILGNFNQLYKIEPTTFRSWLRILARAPKAILWLLRFPELGEANLRRTAKAWAGSEVASRLVFTDVAPKTQHISRARVCDLFLDTPECNAHTTAADVLWSSTPLLTLPRYPYKMCSRMAASIVRGALPKTPEGQQVATELIAESEAEYEAMAVRLATGLSYSMESGGYGVGCGRLAEMRKLLWNSKWHCGLFDTRRWVHEVETAYEEAWRRWVAGEGGDIYL